MTKPSTKLTPAEQLVLNGIVAGASNETIARCRGTSARTVANQVASVFRKFGVGSRAELVARLHVGSKSAEPHEEALAHAHAPLTAGERETLSRAVLGHSNKQVAHDLGLAPSTVAGHLAKAAAKLGARSRVELITMCRVVHERSDDGASSSPTPRRPSAR